MGHNYSSAVIIFTLISSAVYNCRVSSSGCTASFQGEAELRKARLEQLKGNILAQLGFAEQPEPEKEEDVLPTTVEEERKQNETIEQYWNLVQGATSEPKCTSEEFYAKPISTFVGIMSPTEGLALRFRRQVGDEDSSTPTRLPGEEEEEQGEVVFEAGILNQYTIHMHVDLPENLSVISKANLLLHQAQTDTINQPVLDSKQLIQIRAIINNVRYYVDKKSLSVYGHGPQLFNVLRAMELWVEGGKIGEVVLEVLVTCSSSPNCSSKTSHGSGDDLKLPAAVTFIHDSTNSSQLPRVIALSKNPLEAANTHWNTRKKRDTPETEAYCQGEDTTCCLHPLNISFAEDLDINVIQFPSYFTANYCDGFCHSLDGLGASDRTRLLQYLRDSPSISVEPCCSGIEYKPLEVLMRIFNPVTRMYQFKIDRLEQVIVTKCKCS